jgi:DNA-binding SARP family transcriptional activator/CheY-like chemotaxis protein
MELVADDASLRLSGRKERLLLAVLAVHAGREVSLSSLVDALWDGAPPRTATRSLHVYVSRLRQALAGDGDGDTRIDTRPSGYLLHVAAGALDTHTVVALTATARTRAGAGDHAGAVAAFDEALATWRGRSLGDLADDRYLHAEAARLDELRVTLAEERIESLLALGAHAKVIGELEMLCAAHPFRERLVGHRMIALYRSARQTEALAAFQDLRVRLRDDLGLDPNPALVELERAILRQDPALQFQPAADQPAPAPPTALRVMIVDDHPMWRSAIRVLLERAGDVVVVAEASDGDAAVTAAIGAAPSIVLMDLHLPGIGGVEATRRILAVAPDTRVLVVSASEDEADVREALRAGAHGYNVKTGTAREVVDAVRRVEAGEPVFSSAVGSLVLTELRRPEAG